MIAKRPLHRKLYEFYAQLSPEEVDGETRHEPRDESGRSKAGGHKPLTKRKGRRL